MSLFFLAFEPARFFLVLSVLIHFEVLNWMLLLGPLVFFSVPHYVRKHWVLKKTMFHLKNSVLQHLSKSQMFRILVTFQKISEKLQWSCLSSSTLRNKSFLPCKHLSLSFLLVSLILWSFLESFFWYSFLTSSKIKLCNASSQCDEPIVPVFFNILYPFVFWKKNRKRIFS